MITAETIDHIVRFQGDGLPVISLYARVDPGARRRDLHTRVSSLLDEIRPLGEDTSIERERRLSVRADIKRIKKALGEENWQPEAIAIFSCGARDLYEEVRLPQRVRDRVVVDATPYVRPMLAVLDQYLRSCVVVIDKASARVWEIYQGEMRDVTKVPDRVLRKPDYAAGLAEDRVHHTVDELSKRYDRHVVESLDDLFRADGCDILIVGGHDHEVSEFLEFLPRELRDRVAGSFTIDPAGAPVAEIRRNADSIAARYQRDEEQRLVTEVLEKVAAGGLATADLGTCLWAGTVGAIQTLLVQEGATAPGVVCGQWGWLALSGDFCPLCGNPTRHTPDVIDELVEAVIDEGGSVEHVEAGTGLGEYKVAAALSFPLPPMPSARP